MSVGFEFGMNVQVWKEQKAFFSRKVTKQTVPKETSIYGGRGSARGWSLETDGGEAELVIDPPLGEGDQTKLDRIFGDIRRYFTALDLARQGGETEFKSPDARFFNRNAQSGLVMKLPDNGHIAGQPQVTIGIRLGRVRMLFEEMARLGARSPFEIYKGGSGFYPRTAGNAAAVGRNAPDVNGHRASEHLRGLITMVAQYLSQGSSQGPRAYVKYMTFAMARTDFVGMFKRIRTREKSFFREDPQRWVDYALDATGFSGRGNQPLINFKITDGVMNVDEIGAPQLATLTRERWLRSMADGRNAVDLLTKVGSGNNAPYLDAKGGHRLRALGLLGRRTDEVGVDGQNHGVVIEFRTLRHGVRWNEWHNLARSFMTYVETLNRSSKADLRQDPAELGWTPA